MVEGVSLADKDYEMIYCYTEIPDSVDCSKYKLASKRGPLFEPFFDRTSKQHVARIETFDIQII